MRITFAVAVSVSALGACYQEYQPATTPPPQFGPQPTTVYGPPGGEIDPGYAYAGPSGEITVGAEFGVEGGGGGVVASADATAPISDGQIESTLEGYGYWVEDDEYGRIWRPDATVVGVDFTPYETCGTWLWTDYGWTYSCDWDWGWLPFHYGTWGWFDDYWAWVPGYEWSPAWVEWRTGGGYVGWRPLGPRTRDHRNRNIRDDRGPIVRDHRNRRSGEADWRFVGERDFSNGRRIRPSLLHTAEGLARTRMVATPGIRASAPAASTRVADIMRNRAYTRTDMRPNGGSRGSSTGSWQQPSRPQPYAPAQPTWQQRPSRSYQPQPYTPAQPQPYTPAQPRPSGSWQQQPSRTYTPMTPSAPQPRPSTFHQPSRTYTPMTPSQPSRPSSSNWRSTPSAPSRTYTPSAPSPSSSSSSSSRGSSSSSWHTGGSSRASSSSSGGGRRR